MGLLRHARPTAAVLTTGWVAQGGATSLEAVNKEFGTYDHRSSSGPVTTDVAAINDAKRMRIVSTANAKLLYTFSPVMGDDDISSLTLHARVTVTGAGTETIRFFHRHAADGLDYSFATTSVSALGSTIQDISATVANDPSGSGGWNSTDNFDELRSGAIFGISTGDELNTVTCGRLHLIATFNVGPTMGRSMRLENWRWCDICARRVPYSQIERPAPPHPKAGFSVCGMCYDELDNETLKLINRTVPHDKQDALY